MAIKKPPTGTRQNKRNKRPQSIKRQVNKSIFWDSIIRAAEAEPREVDSIRGSSGIQHPVITAGVDEKRQRLIIITKDHDARSAAMMQADIQSAYSSIHVIVARPILWSLAAAARSVSNEPDLDEADEDVHSKISRRIAKQVFRKELHEDFFLKGGGLHQFYEWTIKSFEIIEEVSKQTEESILSKLTNVEPDEDDRRFGLCPVPLYKFTPEEFALLARGRDIGAIKDVLHKIDILQYFFPPPDQLALGIIDRVSIKKSPQLVDQLQQAPTLGHPFSRTEITQSRDSLADIIDELQERKLFVEGEIGFELTPEGESMRRTLRFKPREGLLSKLINRFSFNIDLKDLFRGGGGT